MGPCHAALSMPQMKGPWGFEKAGGLLIACGSGYLMVLSLQLALVERLEHANSS